MEKDNIINAYSERKRQEYLKPSMFNRIVNAEEGITLYNSAHGTSGILRISPENAPEVSDILTKTCVKNTGSKVITKLLSAGYLVAENVDEKAFRSSLHMKFLSQNRLHLVIHVTRACNFRCVYCYMDFEPVFLTENTQQGIINFVRKNIHNYNGIYISWFGGEPLLGVDIIERVSSELISICKLHSKPYAAVITTNGFGLSPDVYERLTRCRVNNYVITIDGTKKLHDKQRVLVNGEPTFDTIINNLLYIKNNYKSPMHSFNLRSNITIDHYDTILEFYEYLYEQFGDDSRFQFFLRGVGDYGGDKVKSLSGKLMNGLTDIYKLLKNSDMKFAFYTHFSELEVGGYTCSAKKMHKYTIGCYGTINKCDEDLPTPLGTLDSTGRMELDDYNISEWTGIRLKCNDCDNCFLSCCCIMEQCPIRKYEKEQKCKTDFNELDALIAFAGKALEVEII